MPTLLTNARMNPELAARIESSVTGRRRTTGPSFAARRIVSIARFAIVATIAVGLYNVVTSRRHAHHALERAREGLLERVRAERESMTPDERAIGDRVMPWLVASAGLYEGDTVSEELHAPGTSSAPVTLARPMIYVRGPIDTFATAAQIHAAAAVSGKDALLLCFLDPPASRAEAALFEKVRVVHARGSSLEDATANVRRLHEPLAAFPFLVAGSPWSSRVEAAEDSAELVRLRGELDRAPIDRAKQASKAQLLLAAFDEPGTGAGPTELDGERPHAVRVTLVDLGAAKVLFRVRRLVDPSWISAGRRSTYAGPLDACALGFDLREELRAPPGSDPRQPAAATPAQH